MTSFKHVCLLGLVAGLGFVATPAFSEDGHSLPHHHLALFVGAGEERLRGVSHAEKAIGVEYELRFEEKWGIGAVLERVDVNHHTNKALVVPFSYHPGGNWRFFAGPGYEFTENKDKFLVRLGGGYEFHLNDRWTISPEVVFDSIDGGSSVYLLGIAVGYGF